MQFDPYNACCKVRYANRLSDPCNAWIGTSLNWLSRHKDLALIQPCHKWLVLGLTRTNEIR